MRRGRVFLSGFNQSFKRLWLITGHIGENFTVQSDTGFVKPVHKAAIGHSVKTRGGVNTLDPKGAKLALFKLTANIGVFTGFFDGLIGNPEGVFTAATVTLGRVDNFFVAGVFRNTAFYT